MASKLDPRLAFLLKPRELEELLLFRRMQHESNTDHRKYPVFTEHILDSLSEEECFSRFRFYGQDIKELVTRLGLPAVMTATNGTKWTNLEGICILLRRLNYPKRLKDLIPEFGRHMSDISIIFNEMIYRVHDRWDHLLTDFNQPFLAERCLQAYADAIHDLGCPLTNCFGFIDGTLIKTCRPTYNQRDLYNGKDRVHGLKFQSLTLPNGMIANLYRPIEGRRHDSTLLRESNLLGMFDQYHAPDGSPLAIYGDKAYPISHQIITPFRGVNLTADEREFNVTMNRGRIAVEWSFGKIAANFAEMNYYPNLKVYLQPVGLYYRVATFLTNCHSCFYGNQTCDHFGVLAPSLQEYLN